jgi:ribose 5-phosphate isomerase B
LRIALGSDERSHLTDLVEQELRRRGFEVELFGPLSNDPAHSSGNAWPDVARAVAERVASGGADEGLLFCWTGTGVSITANKVPGVRAALCWDAETARGARAWNQANVLCMSLRSTSETVAREILDAWFCTSPDPSEEPNVNKVRELDERYRRAAPAAATASSTGGQKGSTSGG